MDCRFRSNISAFIQPLGRKLVLIRLQEGEDPTKVDLRGWKVALHGIALDDRGRAVVNEIRSRSKHSFEITYSPDDLEVTFDNARLAVDDFAAELSARSSTPIVLEATTLGFVEILLCCRALKTAGIQEIDIIYVEPGEYKRPRSNLLLHRRDFELSSSVPGYRAIPGNAILLGDRKPQKGVFFLGFEDARLLRAFEDLQMINSERTAIVFGVPAFRAGWESDSLANNISVISEKKVLGGMHFCGAENPAAVVELLSDIYAGLSADERLFLAPIGTKPHGVGAALFLTEHTNVGVIYDHPHRKSGRSSDFGNWHVYSINAIGSQ